MTKQRAVATIPVDVGMAWRAVDPAHRGAVLADLMQRRTFMMPTADEEEAGDGIPDIAAQLRRREALAEAYARAFDMLNVVATADEEE